MTRKELYFIEMTYSDTESAQKIADRLGYSFGALVANCGGVIERDGELCISDDRGITILKKGDSFIFQPINGTEEERNKFFSCKGFDERMFTALTGKEVSKKNSRRLPRNKE